MIQTKTCMDNTILQAKDLTKDYRLKHRAIGVLKGVNLSLQRGEKLLISGRSGEGKSTLLHLLAGLEPCTSGEIIFEGQVLNKMSNEELSAIRHKKAGIIFQNFNLLASWTAIENVEAALFFSELSKKERRSRAEKILTAVGLEDRFDNLPAELSVGQQQRVAVARAIVNRPEIIFADEPTGDVDKETAAEIISFLMSWIESRKASLLVVTHGEFPVEEVSRVLFLRDGLLKP